MLQTDAINPLPFFRYPLHVVDSLVFVISCYGVIARALNLCEFLIAAVLTLAPGAL
jgi:hypothetical protein